MPYKNLNSELDSNCCSVTTEATCSSPYVYTAGTSCGGSSVATCCVCPANTYLDRNSCVELPNANMVSPQGSVGASSAKCMEVSSC
jgi:hypothetical protein